MENIGALKIELHETEERLLTELRTLRRGLRGTQDGSQASRPRLTIGQRVADAVAETMGSWTFIIIQSFLLVVWIALNVTRLRAKMGSLPVHLAQLGAFLPGRLCSTLHHDESESTARYRSQVCRRRF